MRSDDRSNLIHNRHFSEKKIEAIFKAVSIHKPIHSCVCCSLVSVHFFLCRCVRFSILDTSFVQVNETPHSRLWCSPSCRAHKFLRLVYRTFLACKEKVFKYLQKYPLSVLFWYSSPSMSTVGFLSIRHLFSVKSQACPRSEWPFDSDHKATQEFFNLARWFSFHVVHFVSKDTEESRCLVPWP